MIQPHSKKGHIPRETVKEDNFLSGCTGFSQTHAILGPARFQRGSKEQFLIWLSLLPIALCTSFSPLTPFHVFKHAQAFPILKILIWPVISFSYYLNLLHFVINKILKWMIFICHLHFPSASPWCVHLCFPCICSRSSWSGVLPHFSTEMTFINYAGQSVLSLQSWTW